MYLYRHAGQRNDHYRIDPFIQQVMQGIVLIVAVFLDVRMNSKKA